jgi:hypothetical protein
MYRGPVTATPFWPGGTTNVLFTNAAGAVAGDNYGGQNSYAFNDIWLAPSVLLTGGSTFVPAAVTTTSVPRPASTIMIMDGSFTGAAPDVSNESGLWNIGHANGYEATYAQSFDPNYLQFWMNQGGSYWSQSGGLVTPLQAGNLIPLVYNGRLNTACTDGHAKSLDWHVTVGDICYWTTDVEGAHPNCPD